MGDVHQGIPGIDALEVDDQRFDPSALVCARHAQSYLGGLALAGQEQHDAADGHQVIGSECQVLRHLHGQQQFVNAQPLKDEALRFTLHLQNQPKMPIGFRGVTQYRHQIIGAINVLQKELRGRTEVNRELFAALFVLGNQVEGNASGAVAKGINVPDWVDMPL